MRLLSLLAAMLLSTSVFAEFYENDVSYVYKVTKYTELLSSDEGIQFTAKMAQKAMVNALEMLNKKGVVPESLLSTGDIEKFRSTQKELDTMTNYLTEFVKEQRARGSKLEWADALPDALMIFGGYKASLSIGAGLGASGVVGLVLMPVKVEKFNIRTGKLVDTYPSLRWNLVVWPSADVGLGVGGGARWRGGLAFIWDLNHSFVKPNQFWGGGLAGSANATFGIGVNLKAGFIGNWEKPENNYFFMLSTAGEFGPTAEAAARLNFTSIIKGEVFLDMISSKGKVAYQDMMKDMSKKMDEFFRESTPEELRGDRASDNK